MKTRFVKDMSKYTGNFLAGMSARQFVLVAAGFAAAVSLGIFVRVHEFVVMGVALIFFALAFFKPERMPLERYIYYWLESHFLNRTTRHYERENVVYEFLWRGKLNGRKIVERKKWNEKRKKEK